MNITKSPMKMVPLRAFISRKCIAAIVVVFVHLAVAVPSPAVAGSAVPDAIDTVEAAMVKPRLAAESPSAASIATISNFLKEESFLSAGDVTVNSSENRDGLALDGHFCSFSSTNRSKTVHEKSVLNELEKTILAGLKLGLFDDFEGRQLLECYHNGILDAFIVNRIQRRVNRALRRLAFSGNPFLPPRLHNGDFIFGYDRHSDPICIYQQYLNAGTLMVAGTGAGKTNVSKNHAIQIAPYVRGLWLVDLRKREFRSLRLIFAQMGIDLRIIRCRKFRINPLQVPYGVEPIEYAAVAADFLVRVFNLPPRASTLLKSTIIKLYIVHGIMNGGQKYPTLFHLREAVRQNRQANPQARQATLDNLETILLALGPEILAYHRGWPVHDLAQQHLVLELTGLPETGKDLILNYLMTAEFISRIARGISNPLMDLWITFDEGQRLFSQRKESAGYGGNALIDLTGLLRGTGIGLEISVLTTNDLSVSIPNLTSTKIIGRCGSLAEYTTAGRFVGMNAEQIEWCSHHMVPGLFVGQVSEGRWRYPFLFTVPLVNQIAHQSVSDREADNSIRKFVTAKLLPA